ncbi:MAG: hypothetical protein M3143_01590 [Actinomycetota bacterium]|nr:hypothetical protein [Actinomycetota bacterium]
MRDTVGAILDGCPKLTVLATSREPLGLAAECPSRLAPLPLPRPQQQNTDSGRLGQVPSVALFLDRAARIRPGFVAGSDELHLVADIVRLVDASMLDATFEGDTRYRMLETLRTFGLDRLTAAGEHATAASRLLRWAVELTAWIDTVVPTEREPDADAVLRRELPNLRAAWRLVRQQDLSTPPPLWSSPYARPPLGAISPRSAVGPRIWSTTPRSPRTRERQPYWAPRRRMRTCAVTTRGQISSRAPASSWGQMPRACSTARCRWRWPTSAAAPSPR